MAIAINVDGVTKVVYGSVDIGYTRNGADVTLEGFFIDIPGDAHGGDDGPPIDVQYLGEMARVRVELTKYDAAQAQSLIYERFPASAAGVPVNTPGNSLFKQDSQFRELVLSSASRTMTFHAAFARAPIEVNKGTKFSTLVCEFECHYGENSYANTVYTIS